MAWPPHCLEPSRGHRLLARNQPQTKGVYDMSITKKDCLATLTIFVILVFGTEIHERLPKWRLMGPDQGAERMIQDQVVKDLVLQDSDMAYSLGLVRGPYDHLPIGKADGVDAGRERLRKLQEVFPTPEAFFPILSKNYLLECFVDKTLYVRINEDNGRDGAIGGRGLRLETPLPFDRTSSRILEQKLIQGEDYQFVARLVMVEYLPVRGGFKANVALKHLSDDPSFLPSDVDVGRLRPEDFDDRGKCMFTTHKGGGGVVDKTMWGRPKKMRKVGTFALRGFVFPGRRLREIARGGFLASEPVIIRVLPPEAELPAD